MSAADPAEPSGCPFSAYAALRAEQPVYRIPGTDRYFVSRHEDIVHVTRHPELFSNLKPYLGGPPTLVDNDPPSHTAYRKIASAAVSPRRLRTLEPRIGEIVDALIDGFGDQVEFVSEFCGPLPMQVNCELLGLSAAMGATFMRWSDDYLALASRMIDDEQTARSRESVAEMNAFLVDAIEQRRARPCGDVISDLAAEPLGVAERTSMIRNLLTAGDVTTRFMLASTMLLLIDHPEARDAPVERLVEESLRLQPPTLWLWRHAVADTSFHGVPIPAGSWLHLGWASANRDEAVFDEPERFDPGRPNVRRHFAFGNGIHFCLGAPLARLEGKVAFTRLLERHSTIELAIPRSEVRRLDFRNHNAPRALPLRLKRRP